MDGTQNIILECARINSLGANQDEDYENKSSWTNKISPVQLKAGDNLSLTNVLVNIPGADSNAIYFQGGETKPGSNIQDNYSLLKLGFYINHNAVNTSAMPLKYITRSGAGAGQSQFTTILTDSTKTVNNLSNNYYGSFYDFQYFYGDGSTGYDITGTEVLSDNQKISRLDNIESCNPNFIMNGKKFAKIHPLYAGWMRSNDANAYQGIGVEPHLLTSDVPILLDQGFTNPQAISDQITLQMNQTNKLYDEDIFLPEANRYKTDAGQDDLRRVKLYNFNGLTYKTITCNLQKSLSEQHRIYSNLAVDEPFLWKYGINIISNAEVDNMQGSDWIKDSLTNHENLRVDYPVIIWQRFIGDDPSDFSIGDTNQYVLYSPWLDEVADGNSTVLTIEDMSKKYIDFNEPYTNIITDDGNGAILYWDSDKTFRIVRTGNVGTNLTEKPGLFVNNSEPGRSKIVAYSKFPKINTSWYLKEHQIFSGLSNFDDFTTTPSDAFAAFATYPGGLEMRWYGGQGSGVKYLQSFLSNDSGGIISGSTYTMTFTLQNVDDQEDPIDDDFTDTPVVIKCNGVGTFTESGTDSVSFTSNGAKTVTLVANNTNITSNGLQIGITANNTTFYIHMTNISIIRSGIPTSGDDAEFYSVENIWTSNYTTVDDNKFYKMRRIEGQEDVEVVVSNSTLPEQPLVYSNVDFNRIFTSVAKGFLIDTLSSNSIRVTDDIGGKSINTAILMSDDDLNNFTYWIFQQPSSVTDYRKSDSWYMMRTSRYQGGDLQNNTLLGTRQSTIVELKNIYRCGQQFLDLQGETNQNEWTYESEFVNLFTAESWIANTNETFLIDDFVGQNRGIILGGENFKYDWVLSADDEENEDYQFEYYLQIGADDGASGIWESDSLSYGTWTYDGITLELTATEGDSLSLTNPEPPALTYKLDLIVKMKNQDFNDPDVLPWNTGRFYYYSFERYVHSGNFKNYYISLVLDGDEDDDSLNGLKGVTYTASGVENEGTWGLGLYSTHATFNTGIANDNFTLTSDKFINLTNIVSYTTSQTQYVNDDTFVLPTDTKMYGFDDNGDYLSTYGLTAFGDISSPPMYFGPNAAGDLNEIIEINSGNLYDSESAAFASNNGKKWSLNIGTPEITITDSDDVEIMKLGADKKDLLAYGWVIFYSEKIINADLTTNDTLIESPRDVGSFTTTHDVINNDMVGPETLGQTGIQWQILGDLSGANITDQGTFETFENKSTENYKAEIEKHQLLMTNIKYTQANLEMFKDFFRYNEIYSGSKTKRTEIRKDYENYYVEFDLGRGSDIPDVTHDTDTTNTTGQTPLEPYYMYDSGYMGNSQNVGSMSPMRKLDGNEQRIQVFTRWFDGYEGRVLSDGMLDFQYCYGDTLTTTDFKADYKDLYDYVNENNIGCIPFKAKDGTLRIAFECFKDYAGELYKIQNFTYFIYSPQIVDHNYVTIWNPDAPADKDNDYNYTSNFNDFCNFINIGATEPNFDYNDQLNKFSWKYWYTPTFFNRVTNGGSDANLGQEIARFFDNADNIIYKDYPTGYSKGVDDNRRHNGINDSQAGIFLIDGYFKNISGNYPIYSTDNGVTMMTPDNFYNSLWFRLGFTYYNLKPIKYSKLSFHNNRFSNKSYNNTLSNQTEGLVPFTTNSLVNINDMPGMNVYSQNSGSEGTENPNKGTPIYGLGYNNVETVAVQTESDVMYSKSLPVNITSGFFRIYTDLPTDTLQYTANSNLNCIGIGLLNYASSSQFFFSYAMDYGVSITRDVTISSIRIEIRDERGSLILGLGDRSTVVLKVSRPIIIGPKADDPEIDLLTDIDNELKGKGGDLKNGMGDDDIEGQKEQVNSGQADFTRDDQHRLYNNLMGTFMREIIADTPIHRGDSRTDIVNRIFHNVNTQLNQSMVDDVRNAVLHNNFRHLDEIVNKHFRGQININSQGQVTKAPYPRYQDLVISPEDALKIFEQRGKLKKDDIDKLYKPDGKISTSASMNARPEGSLTAKELSFITDKEMITIPRPYSLFFNTSQMSDEERERIDSDQHGAQKYKRLMRESYNNGNVIDFKRNLSKYIHRVADISSGLQPTRNTGVLREILGNVNDKTPYIPRRQQQAQQQAQQEEKPQGGAIETKE